MSFNLPAVKKMWPVLQGLIRQMPLRFMEMYPHDETLEISY